VTAAFFRAYRIQVGTIEIDAREGVGANSLRIAFQVERDHKRQPNNCELVLWNLSSGSRDALSKLATVPVSIEAGYAGDVGTIFLGDLRSARSRREGPDMITRVSAGDGETKIRTARISRTFAAGTPIGDVLGQLGTALGVKPGNLSAFRQATLRNGGRTLTRALTISGSVFDELERVTSSCGLDWSVQNGELQLRDRTRPATGTADGPLLRADTGLVGEVETEVATETKDGVAKGQTIVSGSCLMRADLIPGRSFRCEEQRDGGFQGNLLARSTVHIGDSHSTDQWITQWSGVPY
jgi:hypothetical protein